MEVGGGVWMMSVGPTSPPLKSDPGGFPRSQDGGGVRGSQASQRTGAGKVVLGIRDTQAQALSKKDAESKLGFHSPGC